MYAVIRTGGKQYRVAEGQTVQVERDVLALLDGTTVSFNEVLMLGGDTPKIGAPVVDGAKVTGTVLGEKRGDKIIVFKKKRRKQYKRKQGHRQELVSVRIDRIES